MDNQYRGIDYHPAHPVRKDTAIGAGVGLGVGLLTPVAVLPAVAIGAGLGALIGHNKK